MEERVRRGGLVWPIILIGAGVMFLLNNFGLVSWNVWGTLWRLWPVLLIAVGLDILIGRRSLVGSLLVALVLIGILAAAAVYGAPRVASTGSPAQTQQINQGLEGASQGDIDIEVGTANLTLREAAETGGLAEGTIALGNGERLAQRFWKTGETAHLELHAEGAWPNVSLGIDSLNRSWDLQLNPDIPLRLKLNAGVGNSTVDLSHLKVNRLDVNAGVGNMTLTLPRSGQVSVTVDGAVGRMRLIVPAGMAARVRVDRGLGSIDVSREFEQRGDEYISRGYDTASDRADIQLTGGVGRIEIEQSAGG